MRFTSLKFELSSFAFFDVEIDPDPIQHRSGCVSDRFGPTEEPAVLSFGAAYPKTHLARTAGAQAFRPNPSCLITIIRMQESDVKVPLLTGARTETERMILGQTSVIG
jgi:hypothetical protein